MFRFVALFILGSNESVYLKVLRDVLCEIPNLNNWWIMLFFGVHYKCSECSSEMLYHLSKEIKMKRIRKAFVKVFKKLSWFLLISGLGLILAC